MEGISGTIGLAEVTNAIRTRNEGKMAALGALAYGTAVKFGMERLTDYLDSLRLAHEAGCLEEAQALALCITQVTAKMGRDSLSMEAAIQREIDAQRAAA